MSELRKAPAWILLMTLGGICIIVGASQQLIIAGSSIQFLRPYNWIVVGVGVVFLLMGILEFRKQQIHTPEPKSSLNSDHDLLVKEIVVTSIDVSKSGEHPRARLTGKIVPPVQGIKIWLLREHFSDLPGSFHVGARPALTDKNGEWQQFTYLWEEGSFRIHAVVAHPNAEIAFSYYREAFEHARKVYSQTVDRNANTFPDWPLLSLLPSGCISDYKTVVI
ncbi:MAG: hypothetical protein ACJ754_17130 [Pyrinomonadaceae bacterium]